MVAGVLEKKGGGDKKEMGGACAQDEPIRARARELKRRRKPVRKMLACKNCGKKYKRVKHLANHVRTCKRCETCGKVLTRNAEAHVRSCQRRFNNAQVNTGVEGDAERLTNSSR